MSSPLFDNEWSLMVAGLGADALVQAGIVKKEDYALATRIIGEEIFVRLVGGERPAAAPAWIFIESISDQSGKSSCVELIEASSNLDRQEAEMIMDSVIDGSRELVELGSIQSAEALARELRSRGAKVKVGAP